MMPRKLGTSSPHKQFRPLNILLLEPQFIRRGSKQAFGAIGI
jgi:hypothetical protein